MKNRLIHAQSGSHYLLDNRFCSCICSAQDYRWKQRWLLDDLPSSEGLTAGRAQFQVVLQADIKHTITMGECSVNLNKIVSTLNLDKNCV